MDDDMDRAAEQRSRKLQRSSTTEASITHITLMQCFAQTVFYVHKGNGARSNMGMFCSVVHVSS